MSLAWPKGRIFGYYNPNPIKGIHICIDWLCIFELRNPLVISDVPKLADDILPSRFTKKKGSSMKDNKKKKNKGTSKRKHKYPYKKRQQANKHHNSGLVTNSILFC